MKSLILALALALGSQVVIAEEPRETRKVCVDVKDKEGKPVKEKDGKTKQNCKEVKVHKKLEGAEKVPEPKKK
jgi:hypothetical protein